MACLSYLDVIRRAEYFIANFEDVEVSAVENGSWLIGNPTHKILISRSVLNLVASRLEGFGHLATKRNSYDDRRFLEMLLDHSRPPKGWLVIHFDEWVAGPSEYREMIARDLGMNTDLPTGVSRFGGGSSFSGMERAPTAEELMSRYRQIVWPPHVVELLLEPKYRTLLTEAEIEFLESHST